MKKKNIETRKLTGIDKVHVLLLNENVNSFTLIKVHFVCANNNNILFFCLFVQLALNFTWIHFRIIQKKKFSKHFIQFIKFNCLDGPMKLIDRSNSKITLIKWKINIKWQLEYKTINAISIKQFKVFFFQILTLCIV